MGNCVTASGGARIARGERQSQHVIVLARKDLLLSHESLFTAPKETISHSKTISQQFLTLIHPYPWQKYVKICFRSNPRHCKSHRHLLAHACHLRGAFIIILSPDHRERELLIRIGHERERERERERAQATMPHPSFANLKGLRRGRPRPPPEPGRYYIASCRVLRMRTVISRGQ